MKITILAGGTGSIALQQGLFELIGKNSGSQVKVIVNAYDNGLSTGAVRKVFDGKILGPSDVRKNQSTRARLLNRDSKLLSFLDHRFSAPASDAERYALATLEKAQLSKEKDEILTDAIKSYFAAPLATKIDYSDFSVANIVYAGLAAKHKYSLRAAAKIMAEVLEIEDNVILNDDTSLFLGAITKSGTRITDEGDIVAWNNPADPIVDVFFTDAQGEEKTPILCQEAIDVLIESDVIILSSGTQWSSLIPTYTSTGFVNTVKRSKAKILMVMNKVPDKDAPNMGADEIVNTIIPKYFPLGRVDLIYDLNSEELMRHIRTETAENILRSVNGFELGMEGLKISKHWPSKLAKAVVKTIFRDYLNADAYMFDYDDTLVGRGNSFRDESTVNLNMIAMLSRRMPNKFSICTGNSIKAIKIDMFNMFDGDSNSPLFTVYADGGVNKYEYDTYARNASNGNEELRPYTFIECLVPEAQFAETGINSIKTILSTLRLAGIPSTKIENRGNVMLSIKPVDPEYREIVRTLAAMVLKPTQLKVKSAGRTTIEIADSRISKRPAVMQVLEQVGENGSVVFVGDEFDHGNDREVALMAEQDKRVKCLRVNNPSDTALFLAALTPSQ